jgi:hypothetical protein
MATLIIEVHFPEPGGRDLAKHLRERLELAVLRELDDLSEVERSGIQVTSEIEEV